MEKPVQQYWNIRLRSVKEALEENNFEVFIADDSAHAKEIFLKEIYPGLNVKSVSWGGSMTFIATGLYDHFKNDPNLEVLDAYDRSIPRKQMLEIRRKSLLVDLFFTGTNAITEAGQLINLDMIGNRVGAITFGPKNVIVFAGRNKIVGDIEDGMNRIKEFVAPANAMRLDMKTPCVKTSYCEECKSPQRICNTWTITEKSFPKGRIKVILINQDLGL